MKTSVVLKQFMVWVIAGLKINPLNLSIRGKLLLISAVLVIVPWVGVQYIQDMENFLRVNQENNLLGRAQVVAAVLEAQEEVFQKEIFKVDMPELNDDERKSVSQTSHLYVRPLKSAVQLDGYLDDWENYKNRAQQVTSDKPGSAGYTSYIGAYSKYLYLMLEVTDDVLVYRKPGSLSLVKSDHLKIVMKDQTGNINHYIVTTQSQGWVNAHRVVLRDDEWVSVAPELRIKGEWLQTAKGYNLEVRIPRHLIGNNLSFFIADVDDMESMEIERLIGSTESPQDLGTIIIPSVEVEGMLNRVVRPASRTWVLDRQYRVLAVAGSLRQKINYSKSSTNTSLKDGVIEGDIQQQITDQTKPGMMGRLIRVFYQILLKQPTQNFEDELSTVSYLEDKTIQSALAGNPAISWRDTPDKKMRILTASYPVLNQGKAIGAIAIEETSNSILILQNRAMEILINLSVLTFVITVVVLLSYASRLSVRIRRLRDQAETAISSEGRITNIIKGSNAADEIGDLSRSFSGMLSRLGEYNRYLETMAGKLSHELRTPVTVVRSSLENLQYAKTDEARATYIERASEGMERLSDILTRMSEATRLEQTLQAETCEKINFSQLIENCTAAYRLVYPDIEFNLKIDSTGDNQLLASPELLAQMLDKLVSNAVDFHLQQTPIQLHIVETDINIQLSVINQGELLPEHMQDNLFESMVSVRTKRGNRPHLGLGLYIVRMIVEFHNGTVVAKNTQNNNGVEIRVSLPRQVNSELKSNKLRQ